MLHTESVKPSTLELLKSLQQKEYLKEFYLVGGTALALYYGHRHSIDIDLFSNEGFDTEFLLENILHDFKYQLSFTAQNTLKGVISDVNVDIIARRYPYLQKPRNYKGISLLSEQDIIAMKLNAISVSGQRSKDFIDVYYSLNNYSIADMISFYEKKYNQQSSSHILKSLIYFDDVDLTDWPVMIKDPNLQWTSVKEKLENEVMEFFNEG